MINLSLEQTIAFRLIQCHSIYKEFVLGENYFKRHHPKLAGHDKRNIVSFSLPCLVFLSIDSKKIYRELCFRRVGQDNCP
jgi:hypothetical protein